MICLHCIDEVAVNDLVYRTLAHKMSPDFFLKRHILLSRLKTTPTSILLVLLAFKTLGKHF